MAESEIEKVEKNLVGSMENIQNNLAGTIVNVEKNILSTINNLNLQSTTHFPHGVLGYKFYRPDYRKTVAQLNLENSVNEYLVGTQNTLYYSQTKLTVIPSRTDDNFIDPGLYQKYLGANDNVYYWIGNGFITTKGNEGVPISFEFNPTNKVLYGHIMLFDFKTHKFNFYGLTKKSQFFTIHTVHDAESAIKNGDAIPWFEPAMKILEELLKSNGLDIIGDIYKFEAKPIYTYDELTEAYLKFVPN